MGFFKIKLFFLYLKKLCCVIMFVYWTCSVQHIYSNIISVRVNSEHNMLNNQLSMKT